MRLHEIETNEKELLEKYQKEIRFAADKFIEHNVAIYRGSETYSRADVMLTDPTARTTARKSAMRIGNYYTLWMDNSPKWREYPKRSRSLICCTDRSYAGSYGTVRVVIPLVNTKIGVCLTVDIWRSFRKSVSSLGDFSDWLQDKLSKVSKHDPKNLTYTELLHLLGNMEVPKEKIYTFTNQELLSNATNGVKLMDEIFDPDANSFWLTDWNNFKPAGPREVWLSAPCLLMHPNLFMSHVKDVEKQM